MKYPSMLVTACAAFITASALAGPGPAPAPRAYPLKKCVVSGDALGEHGKAIKVTYQGTDIYLCCNDCVKDFKKNPAKYVKMVKEAKGKK